MYFIANEQKINKLKVKFVFSQSFVCLIDVHNFNFKLFIPFRFFLVSLCKASLHINFFCIQTLALDYCYNNTP